MDGVDIGVIELLLIGAMGILGYLWRNQAADIQRTSLDLNKLSISFAEAKGGAEATNRTLFANIEELKEAIHRVENLLLSNGGKKDSN
jgi:hypothetical protein